MASMGPVWGVRLVYSMWGVLVGSQARMCASAAVVVLIVPGALWWPPAGIGALMGFLVPGALLALLTVVGHGLGQMTHERCQWSR